MKKIFTLILSTVAFLNSQAGVSIGGNYVIGSSAQVHSNLHSKPSHLLLGNNVQYPIKINYSSDNVIIGSVVGYPNSHFSINTENGEISGTIIVSKEKDIAFQYSTNAQNQVVVEPIKVGSVLCTDYGTDYINTKEYQIAQKNESVLGIQTGGPVPLYQSLPGSPNVLFLDFDGYNLPAGSHWHGGVAMYAPPAGYTDADIYKAWSITAEDYAPFNLNVTTDSAVFSSAALGHRMRMVLTTDSLNSGAGGGIAYINVFNNLDEKYHPGWICVRKMAGSASNAAEATSHEAGHTLNLQHHGTVIGTDTLSYYNGHSTWGAIMGTAYNRSMSQFCIGEYANAHSYKTVNKQKVTIIQDDLLNVSNILGYKADDFSNTTATADEISYTMNATDGVVDSLSNHGLINNRADIDAFHFYTGGGTTTLNIKPSAKYKTNVDLNVKLYDANKVFVDSFYTAHNNTTINGVILTKTLASGDYYFTIDGAGTGNPTTGWSDYNSMGPYYITGTIANASVAGAAIALNNGYIALDEMKINVFPNPINNDGLLRFSELVDDVKVYDATGRIIASAFKSKHIELGDQLAQGIYIIEINTNNQHIITKVLR